jgi:hypothetical protein
MLAALAMIDSPAAELRRYATTGLLAMQLPTILSTEGACADVWDMGDGTVVKAFRRQAHTTAPPVEWEDHDFVSWLLAAVEMKAYERVRSDHEIAVFVPEYFGAFDAHALPPSPSGLPYISDAAFRIEKISGEAIKIARVPNPPQQDIEKVLERIAEVAGRVNVWDCSCFVPAPRGPFVVIDFAYPEDVLDLSIALRDTGHLGPDLKQRVKLFAGVA